MCGRIRPLPPMMLLSPIMRARSRIRFRFDLETSVYSDEFIRMVDDLSAVCEEFQYLGSYSEVI